MSDTKHLSTQKLRSVTRQIRRRKSAPCPRKETAKSSIRFGVFEQDASNSDQSEWQAAEGALRSSEANAEPAHQGFSSHLPRVILIRIGPDFEISSG